MVAPHQHRRGRNTRSHALPTSTRRRSRASAGKFKFRLRQNAGALKCKNNLKASFLNVDGLSDAKLEDVTATILSQSPDICFLFETKRRSEEIGIDISVPGYEVSEVKRSDASGDRAGGGIAIYTKNTDGLLFNHHSPAIVHADLEFVQNERFWVTIDSMNCRTAICGVYMACQLPDDRHGEWNNAIYWVLRQECEALRSSGYRVVVLGDMNGHVGNQPGQGVVGNNADINRNGERFLSFLKDCDMRHLNGELRVPGDITSRVCNGLWTRQRGNSRSVIDFVSISSEHVSTTTSMTVDDTGLLGGGSDHNWVAVVLSDKFRHLGRVKHFKQPKKMWNLSGDFDWSAFKKAVVERLPTGSWDHLSVNEHASLLISSLHSAGESVIGFRQPKKKTSMKSRSLPVHMVSAIKRKRELERTWKSLSSSSDNNPAAVIAAEDAFVDQARIVGNMFKTLISSKRKDTFGVDGLGSKSTPSSRKKFWSAVTGKIKQNSTFNSVLSPDGALKTDNDEIRVEIENHLCSVYQGSLDPIPTPEPPAAPCADHAYAASVPPIIGSDHIYRADPAPVLPQHGTSDNIDTDPSSWLGRKFSLQEVKVIASALSGGKAFGWDNIPPEFLKNAPDQALSAMALLFDKIKDTGVFPEGWNCGRITLIHKKGLRAKLGNYRPITVLVSMSSFFSKLLNQRLIEVVETHKLLGEAQNGFRQGRCGADNIFVLNTILWRAKALGENVHLGFVDISKAYDSVNREVLWKKLENIGIRGVFLETLKSLYIGDSVRCVFNDTATRPVYLRRGLRQGCSLSPLLFALYICDIGATLSTSTLGFSLGGQPVAGLLFADDIVLIAKSAVGLKTLFHLVKAHCDDLLLEINTNEGKSEVISPDADTWDILDDNGEVALSLRQVLQYKYLGLESYLSITETFKKKQQKCISTAHKYKFACHHIGRRGPDVVETTLATWNNVAIPAILFGCETVLFTEQTIMAVEKVQAEVTKRLLGLPANTANICAQTELGIVPFRLALYKAQLMFYFRVLDMPSTRWAKKALLEHLTPGWPSPYLKYILKVRETVHLSFVPPTTRYLKTHLYSWSLSSVNQTLSNLSLPYVAPLTCYKVQPYVFEHQYLDTIAQFRLSNAGLGNRSPRWAGFYYQRQSHCPLCHNCILTEAHVFLSCPAINTERNDLSITWYRNRGIEKGLSLDDIFTNFVNGLDHNGNQLPRSEIVSNGLALDTLRGHWLPKW